MSRSKLIEICYNLRLMRERKGSQPNSEGLWFGESYTEVEPRHLRALRQRAISYVLGFDPPHGRIDEIEEHIIRFMGQSGTAHELEELAELYQAGGHHSGNLKKSGVFFEMDFKYGEWREDYHRGARHAYVLYDKGERSAIIARKNMAGMIVKNRQGDVAQDYTKPS